MNAEKEELEKLADHLKTERDSLFIQRRELEKEKEILNVVILGLKLTVDEVEKGGTKFFSILNKNDPINKLKRLYGWEMWSDNYFGELGYYLVIRHKNVGSSKKIYVGRDFEIERMKKSMKDDWKEYIERVNKQAPLLTLDYSYFALIEDENAPIGGTLYLKGGDILDFHAPLSEWEQKLGAVFE